MPTTVTELSREIHQQARSQGLTVDSACDGVFNSSLAIVGEAPGEREVALKQVLCGGSGKVLWDTIRQYGITRRSAYLTNVVKRRLLSVDSTKAAISKGELDHWAGLLLWELSQLPNLRHILALGSFALHALTGNDHINNWRGSVLHIQIHGRPVHVLCANNPAAVLREPKNEIVFRLDMGKLNRMLRGMIQEHAIRPIINPSFKDAMQWIDELQASRLPISFDIETIGGETACIGLTNNVSTGMCINFRNHETHQFSLQDETRLVHRLSVLLRGTNKLVAQNGSFDASWLWYKDRVRVAPLWFDTLLGHHTLYPSLPHNLGFLTSQYTDHPFYKDEGKDWRATGDIDKFWEYNVKDCCITLAVQRRLLEELRAQHLDKFFFSHVMRLQPHLIGMTVHGVKVDTSLKDSIAHELSEVVASKEQVFYDAVHTATGDEGYNPNPMSPKQMQELYFKRLRLVGRGPRTDAENRKRMLDNPRTPPVAREMILRLEDFVKDQKFLSTYAEMNIDPDDRVRCDWKQYGVTSAPGRLSSSATLWGCGMNMQNQPQRAYPMFVADTGYEFSYFDMAQIEARLVAYFANIKEWKEQFERARVDRSYDCHRALAAIMFNMPYDQVPIKDRDIDGVPTIRYIAKRCRHGLNYRMGPDRLAQVTGLSIADATRNHRVYHKINPELEVWWNDTIKEVTRTRELWTPMGRRWTLLERPSDTAFESIIAFKPQSTAGDKVAGVIYKCHEDPEWPTDARIVLNIHDALIALNRPADGPLVREIMRKHAEEPIIINGESLIIPAEFGVSHPDEQGVHRWSTIKKI